MKSKIKRILKRVFAKQVKIVSKEKRIEEYKAAGSIPWSSGYHEYKWQLIENNINDQKLLKDFKIGQLPAGYGKALDERVIEYPWLITNITHGKEKFLDAGSTFNFQEILDHPALLEKEIYIYTFFPEENNFSKKRISYVYGDLRELPFKNDFFDMIVCHSTLEHIDMDNSMYGYDLEHQQDSKEKNYDYIKVITELERIVKPGGKILLTFPFGKFENHGFFQQFDTEMVQRIEDLISSKCNSRKSFAKYELEGWKFTKQTDCADAISYNPHTGKGKGNDNAAHSRAICFMEIQKNR